MDRKYLGELGVPALPGGFLDVLTYFSRNDNANADMGTIQMSELTNPSRPHQLPQGQGQPRSNSTGDLYGKQPNAGPSGSQNTPISSNGVKKSSTQDKGKGRETPPTNPLNISGMSRMFVPFPVYGMAVVLTFAENGTS